MAQCEKEWQPSNLPGAITKQGNYDWCQCLVNEMARKKSEISESISRALAADFRESLGKVWSDVRNADYYFGRCFGNRR